MDDFSIRLAQTNDAETVWEINNSPDVRAVSITPEPIPWEDHISWFESAVESTDRFLYVIVNDDSTLGVVRLDRQASGETFELSIALAAKSRGRGIGTKVLRAAFEYGPAEMTHIIALIRPENRGSVTAFQRAGFEITGESKGADIDLIRMERVSSGKAT